MSQTAYLFRFSNGLETTTYADRATLAELVEPLVRRLRRGPDVCLAWNGAQLWLLADDGGLEFLVGEYVEVQLDG